MRLDRRRFMGTAAAAAFPVLADGAAVGATEARSLTSETPWPRTPPIDDESLWREVQQAFTVDRTMINLNNGGCCPSPRVVQEAMKRYLDISNTAPVYGMWRLVEPHIEQVREQLARLFGASPEEIAVTRNASEALETVILGLDLAPGDEVLASNQNYPRMLQTWRQRVMRDRIVLKTFSVPTNPKSPQELIDAYASRITPRTRVIEVMHVSFLNGQIWPVREICRLGRAHGITVIVDGAHAFSHFPFKRDDLECDFYGTSLHKWLCAPVGTGMLYVRRERIRDLWAMMPPPDERHDDIRKFEEIGTHPAANHNAISEAITFNLGIGIERKAARLRQLHERWMSEIEGRKGARLLTNPEAEESCGIRLLDLPGLEAHRVADWLLARRGIITAPIKTPEFQGLRITPHVYTLPDEIDRFIEAIKHVQDRGIDA